MSGLCGISPPGTYSITTSLHYLPVPASAPGVPGFCGDPAYPGNLAHARHLAPAPDQEHAGDPVFPAQQAAATALCVETPGWALYA